MSGFRISIGVLDAARNGTMNGLACAMIAALIAILKCLHTPLWTSAKKYPMTILYSLKEGCRLHCGFRMYSVSCKREWRVASRLSGPIALIGCAHSSVVVSEAIGEAAGIRCAECYLSAGQIVDLSSSTFQRTSILPAYTKKNYLCHISEVKANSSPV